MFTGLIQQNARVESITPVSLSLACVLPPAFVVGQSLAVNGICLSAVRLQTVQGEAGCCADISPETWKRTTVRNWKEGTWVHIEFPLQASSFLGGHWVQGHVDGVARVSALDDRDSFRWMQIAVPSSLQDFFIEKGSVAVDGVSLTLNAVSCGFIEIMLIPETLRHTRLGHLSIGDEVNIEADMMSKTIVHHLRKMQDLKRISP